MYKTEFYLKDYLLMFKKGGIGLVYNYFLNVHLFDLIHRTDTHSRITKDKLDQHVHVHTTLYMASWTYEVNRVFTYLKSILNKKFEECTFIDVGSGKGKVIIQWELNCLKNSIKHETVGVEYDNFLIEISKKNYFKVFKRDGNFLHKSVIDYDFSIHKNTLILYLYNPFDEVQTELFLKKIFNIKCLIIYNNPIHIDIFLKNSFTIKKIFNYGHPNTHTIIIEN